MITEGVTRASGDLGQIRGEIHIASDLVRGSRDAAGGTDAADACSAFVQRLMAQLASASENGDRLAVAVGKAAECYSLADEVSMPAR